MKPYLSEFHEPMATLIAHHILILKQRSQVLLPQRKCYSNNLKHFTSKPKKEKKSNQAACSYGIPG